jgi:hypothetical protein
MTWWLQGGQADQPRLEPTTPDLPLASFGEGLSAAFSQVWRDVAVRNEFESRVADEEATSADEVIKRLGMQSVLDGLRQRGIITPSSEGYGWDFLRYQTDARRAVLEMGEDASTQDPEAWKNIDLTTAGAETRVTAAQKKEAQERAQIIAMSPYPMAESILGGIAANVADPMQWPLMLINPGSSFLKVLGWQATLGVASDVLTLPTRIQSAERLGEAPINIPADLGMAAAGGAAFAGLFEGAARLPGILRGVALQAERSRPVPGAIKPHVEPAIAAAEDAIVRDAPLEPAIRSTLPPDEPPRIDFEAQWREVDAATDWEAVLRDAQSRADEPQASTAPDGPDAPQPAPTRAEQRATITDDLSRAEADLKKTAKWFSRYIKKRGGIHPEGQVADELRNAGITSKSMPGLFSRKGARDLDNIDLTTDAEAVAAIGADGFYLDRQGVIDSLITELTGGRIKTPRDELLTGQADNLRAALRDLDLEDQIDTAAGRISLTARERAFVKQKVADGDDIQTAIDYALERDLNDMEAPEVPTDVYQREAEWEPFTEEAGISRAGDGGAFGPDEGAGATGAGPAGAGSPFAVERTAAGQQTLIPGTELRARDTSRERALADLQVRQSKMRRLDQLDPDGMFAPKQMSIFDDPTSPQAMAEVDAQIAEMRASLDPENPTATSVEADDGRVLTTTQAVLREVDELDHLEREFAACLAGGVNVGA